MKSLNTIIGNALNKSLIRHNSVIVNYSNMHKKLYFSLAENIPDLGMTLNEAVQLQQLVNATNKIKGDVAEVGVHKGASAELISINKSDKKTLYLFDTFNGLPCPTSNDDKKMFHEGDYHSKEEEVEKRLSYCKNFQIIQGTFPYTSEVIKDKKFSLVNIDVDLYDTTIACLRFFYPRMNKSGIILIHDYIQSKGVKKAVDTFMKNKPEIIIEMSGTQCLIIKQ